jgi:chromosomal replication initiation ATPase DnaA
MIKPTEEEKKLIDEIEVKVCKYFNTDCQSIISNDKRANTSMTRGFIFYILHVDYRISISKIANTYLRTPRTIFWHVNKVGHLLKLRIYKDMYDKICNIIKV